MSKQTDGMIDIETMDTLPSSIVLTIGGVKFDPDGVGVFDEFHYKIEVTEQEDKGRTISDSTMNDFWAKQSPEVIEAAFSDDDRITVEEMMKNLRAWYAGCSEIWAHGTTFDITILENLHRQYGKSVPWNFWEISDSRTLFKRLPEDPRKNYTFAAHNALEDARIQALSVQDAIKQLNIKLP